MYSCMLINTLPHSARLGRGRRGQSRAHHPTELHELGEVEDGVGVLVGVGVIVGNGVEVGVGVGSVSETFME